MDQHVGWSSGLGARRPGLYRFLLQQISAVSQAGLIANNMTQVAYRNDIVKDHRTQMRNRPSMERCAHALPTDERIGSCVVIA